MNPMQRALGAVVGSAVGDALGAPFEFGPAGAFSTRFPASARGGEMCGGGGWEPGEATDDTQMAVHLGESLVERGGLDLPDVFARFQRWAAAEPKDIGLQTEDVLTNGEPWDAAAAAHFAGNHRAAGNGALMRATTSAVHFAPRGRQAAMDAARQISALTHGDPAAWEGTAVWAVRTTTSYEDAVRAAVDPGGDTDTVAAVAGGLAGAIHGIDAIPARWTAPLHVPLPGAADRVLRLAELLDLARRLTVPPGSAQR